MSRTQIDSSLVPSAATSVQNMNNILDNSGLEIWQRGTSFTFNTASFSTVNVYTADRWSNQAWWASGSPVWTITRESSTIHDGSFSLKFNMTALGTTLQDQRMVGQVVENYLSYAGKTLTFSAWVNTTSSHVNIRLTDGITTAISSNHPGDGQWHQLSCTLTISNSTTGIQVSMAWDTQANATTGAHYLDSVMLVVGSTTAVFCPTNPQVDLARCQRYFVAAQASDIVGGFYNAGGGCILYWHFPVAMRTTPTLVIPNPFTVDINGVGNTNFNGGGAAVGSTTSVKIQGTTTNTSYTFGSIVALEASGSGITASADL